MKEPSPQQQAQAGFLGESSMESAEGGFAMQPPALQMKAAPVQMHPGDDTTPTREENLTTDASLTAHNAGRNGTVHITAPYRQRVQALETAINGVNDVDALQRLAEQHGEGLWDFSCTEIRDANDTGDDRPVYVARLQMTALLRAHPALAGNNADLLRVLDAFEASSRGQTPGQINFAVPAGREQEADGLTQKKVLISGFDPFFSSTGALPVSNPSGAAAMQLDGTMIVGGGAAALIEAVTFPVRYAEFDEGMVESVFRPYLSGPEAVDMVITLSLDPGSDRDFDIEGYATRHRGGYPGNNGVGTGHPDFQDGPQTHGANSPEFITTTLPWYQMLLGTANNPNGHNVRLDQGFTMSGMDPAMLAAVRETRAIANAAEHLGLSVNDLLGMLFRMLTGDFTPDDQRRADELEQLATGIRDELGTTYIDQVSPDREPDDYFVSDGVPTDQTMERASGGSYLSNEIMYRVGRLAGDTGSTVPYGHIHVLNNFNTNNTFELNRNEEIKDTVAEIIRAALPAI